MSESLLYFRLKLRLQLTTKSTSSSSGVSVLDACWRLFGHDVYIGRVFFTVSSRFVCSNIGTEPSSISNVLDYPVKSLSICISVWSPNGSWLVTLLISVMDIALLISSLVVKLVRLGWILQREYFSLMVKYVSWTISKISKCRV